MKVPEVFPEGCTFIPTFSGDDFVEFPDGKVFKFSDDGKELTPAAGLPRGGICFNKTPPSWLSTTE